MSRSVDLHRGTGPVGESLPPEPEPGEVLSRRLTEVLAEAVRETGCSEKEAALSQGYDERYWPRVKSGEKQAHLDRIARLPVKVQRKFLKLYAKDLGLDVRERDAETAAALELAESALRFLRMRA